jgi:hypothetical protein
LEVNIFSRCRYAFIFCVAGLMCLTIFSTPEKPP